MQNKDNTYDFVIAKIYLYIWAELNRSTMDFDKLRETFEGGHPLPPLLNSEGCFFLYKKKFLKKNYPWFFLSSFDGRISDFWLFLRASPKNDQFIHKNKVQDLIFNWLYTLLDDYLYDRNTMF